MRKFVILALVFGALGFTAVGASQNVKAFKGGGGPTGVKSAAPISTGWVKEYWVKAY